MAKQVSGDETEAAPERQADGPLLDLNDAAVKKFIKTAKKSREKEEEKKEREEREKKEIRMTRRRCGYDQPRQDQRVGVCLQC
jgi:hypothetical protein